MFQQLRLALMMLVILTLVTGAIYPLVVTGIAQGIFSHKANGSLIEGNGKAVGSELIGQTFTDLKYFWPRPSATGPHPYNAGASSGSNLGPTNPALMEQVQVRIDTLHAANPNQQAPVPVDLVTASGSGLDPHISPAAAMYQIPRIAQARNINPAAVSELVTRYTEGRQLGFLGEPRVNILQLNLALDALR